MTEPCTERLHRRVNWPPGSCHPPDRGRTLTKHPQQPGRQSAVNSARIHTPSLSESYSMTVFIKERFSRRVYWPPGSWRPPDRRSSLSFWSETARYYSWVAPTCNHNFTSIHFQELNP